MTERRPPSPSRLSRALRAGDTPISSFAVRAGSLAAVLLLLPSLGRAVRAAFSDALRTALTTPEAVAPTTLVTDTVKFVGPLLLASAGAALAAGIAQTGLSLAWRRPAPLAARLFDAMRAYDVARAVLILAAIAFVACHVVIRELPQIGFATGKSGALLERAGTLPLAVAWPAFAVVAALAATDVVVRRTAWIKRLSPSPEEAKRERRESEGDPEARRARRRAHEALAREDAP